MGHDLDGFCIWGLKEGPGFFRLRKMVFVYIWVVGSQMKMAYSRAHHRISIIMWRVIWELRHLRVALQCIFWGSRQNSYAFACTVQDRWRKVKPHYLSYLATGSEEFGVCHHPTPYHAYHLISSHFVTCRADIFCPPAFEFSITSALMRMTISLHSDLYIYFRSPKNLV